MVAMTTRSHKGESPMTTTTTTTPPSARAVEAQRRACELDAIAACSPRKTHGRGSLAWSALLGWTRPAPT